MQSPNYLAKLAILTLNIFFIIFLLSCGVPTPTQSELDLTITANDPTYNFSAARTYVLPAQVVTIQSTNSTGTTALTTTLNDFVINQVATLLNNAGYERLTDPNGPKPSFFVEVSNMQTTTTDVYYSSWSSYWGAYYAPWYGVGYAYAPVPYTYVINSTLGSLIVNMTDPNNPNPTDQKIPSLWVAVLNGIIDGSSQADIQLRIESGLNEAFRQSPYLKAG